MNNDPTMCLEIGGKDFEANRRNTFLYTFLGELAVYDHIFMLTEPDRPAGSFIFKAVFPVEYNDIGAFMVEHHFIAHMNAQEVCEGDQDAFNRATMGDLASDSFPEDWAR